MTDSKTNAAAKELLQVHLYGNVWQLVEKMFETNMIDVSDILNCTIQMSSNDLAYRYEEEFDVWKLSAKIQQNYITFRQFALNAIGDDIEDPFFEMGYTDENLRQWMEEEYYKDELEQWEEAFALDGQYETFAEALIEHWGKNSSDLQVKQEMPSRWFIVDEWFAGKLEAKGEQVIYKYNLCLWGVIGSGYSLEYMNVVRKIAVENKFGESYG